MLHDELIGAAGRIDIEIAVANDLLAVFELEFEAGGGGAPEDAAKLGGLVFEREIDVAGMGAGDVGDFSADPEGAEGGFEGGLDEVAELGDGEDG